MLIFGVEVFTNFIKIGLLRNLMILYYWLGFFNVSGLLLYCGEVILWVI